MLRAQSALGYYPLLSATFKGQGPNQMEKESSQSGFKRTLGHLFKFQVLSEIFSISILKALQKAGKLSLEREQASRQIEDILTYLGGM